MKQKKANKSKLSIISAAVICFALFAVFGFNYISIDDQSSVGISSASTQEPADINNDNVVDIVDLSILLSNWNTTDNLSDINNDNVVDIVDLSILLSKWGSVLATEKYGPAFNMDELQNIRVGGPYDDSVSNRFRAGQTGEITAFRTWFKNGGDLYPGYGAGTGGIISITIETDNGGAPSGVVLGTAIHLPGAANASGVNPGRFSLVSFDNPVPVDVNQIYHVVYRNADSDPQANYSSVNGTYVFGPNFPTPAQPKWPDDSLASMRQIGTGSWNVFPGTTPMLDLTYANGSHEGQGYMEPEVANEGRIEGSEYMVRELITVSGGNKVINGAAFRIAKNSGSGDLLVRLEDGNGSLIDSFSISSDNVPVIDPEPSSNPEPAGIWISSKFSGQHTLVDGQSYILRLSTDNSTSLWTRGIQQGNWYGFHPDTFFSDGVLQFTANGGSTWATVSGLGDAGDLQFYFD